MYVFCTACSFHRRYTVYIYNYIIYIIVIIYIIILSDLALKLYTDAWMCQRVDLLTCMVARSEELDLWLHQFRVHQVNACMASASTCTLLAYRLLLSVNIYIAANQFPSRCTDCTASYLCRIQSVCCHARNNLFINNTRSEMYCRLSRNALTPASKCPSP